ncbi:hypothetical protein J2S53_000996 [Actinopolyspora lacussalsi]|nr:hypothetical protein [Actinopolyspora lacussalsi]
MSVGAHTGIEGAFIYLAFPPELENDPGTVYVDTRVKGYYYRQPEEIAVYRAAMRRLQAAGLSACGNRLLPGRLSPRRCAADDSTEPHRLWLPHEPLPGPTVAEPRPLTGSG